MAATLPPWLAIDPLAPVGRYLQGYQIGASQGQAAAAQRRAEQATALSAQQQSEEMAFRREQAAQVAQIRQQEQALNAQKFGLELRSKQQEYERAAQEAAMQLEGQQGLEKDLASGVPIEKAMLKWAPKLMYRHPEALPAAIRQLTPQPTTLQRDITMADVLKRSAAALRQTGDIPGAESAEYKLSLAEGKMMGPTETIETTPEGVVRIVRGGRSTAKPEEPTVAFKTKLQEELHNYNAPMATLAHMEQNMSAADFGLRGAVGEFMDKYAAQIKPELADPRRISVRNAVRTLRADLYKAFRSDSNIAESERKQMEKFFPSENIDESLPDAMQKLVDVRRRILGKSREAAQRLGVLPPPWALTAQETVNAFRQKQISQSQLFEWLKQYHASEVMQQQAQPAP